MATNTGITARKIGRSKYAVDIMFRLWDEHNSCWITMNSKSLWAQRNAVDKIRDKLIKDGRDPDTLTVERVFVEVK